MCKEIRVAAESRGDQMWMVVRFAYDPSVVKIIRAISGGKYSRMEKYWYFPIRTSPQTIETCTVAMGSEMLNAGEVMVREIEIVIRTT